MQQANPSKLEELYAGLTEYLNLKFDLWKLSLVEGLSVVLSRALTTLILVLCLTVVSLLLTVLAVVALAEVTGLAWALVIVAALYALVAVIVFARRKTLFTDSMVAMLSKLFFNPTQNETEEDLPQ